MLPRKHTPITLFSIFALVSLLLTVNYSDAEARRRWSPDGEETYVFVNACRNGMEYEIAINTDADPHNQQPFTAWFEIDVFVDDHPNFDPNAIGDGLITVFDNSDTIFNGTVVMTYDRSTESENVYSGIVRWASAVEPGQMFLNPEILDWAIYNGVIVASELPLIQDCYLPPQLPDTPLPPAPPPITESGPLFADGQCFLPLGPVATGSSLYLNSCLERESWQYQEEIQRLSLGDSCLSAEESGTSSTLMLAECQTVESQQWEYTSENAFRIYGNQCLDTTEDVVDGGFEAKLVDCADWSGNPWIFTNANSNLRQPELIGDVNCDNEVDSLDALSIIQYKFDRRYKTNYCPLNFPLSINSNRQTLYTHNGVADINSDGVVDIIDGLLLLQCTYGFSNDFCPGNVRATNIELDAAAVEAREILIERGLWSDQSDRLFIPLVQN